MRFCIVLAIALCIGAVSANPVPEGALDAFAGLPEILNGHAPAKDYIVIEILKPLIHYFAAEAHQESNVEKRSPAPEGALDAFAGLPEIQNGHAPAKDYIVIEILKPLIHYFAAEARQGE